MLAPQPREYYPFTRNLTTDDDGDNMQMYIALYAGYDTTSVTISRMLQLLASDDSKVTRTHTRCFGLMVLVFIVHRLSSPFPFEQEHKHCTSETKLIRLLIPAQGLRFNVDFNPHGILSLRIRIKVWWKSSSKSSILLTPSYRST